MNGSMAKFCLTTLTTGYARLLDFVTNTWKPSRNVSRRLSSLPEVAGSLCGVWSVCSTFGMIVDTVEIPFVAPTMKVPKSDFLDGFRTPEVVSLVH